MDFFKTVFSDDLELPSDSQTTPTSPPKPQSHDHDPQPEPSSNPNPDLGPNPNPNPGISTITNAWTFGSSLIKTLASRSESVIETYRRDLEEFGSGLKKETAVIRGVASRAVKDLPTSLEAGAAVAQESLESVGQAIDDFGNSVSVIIAQGKDSILDNDSDTDSFDSKQISSSNEHNLNLNSKPYSRFESQVRAIQCDMNTYCEEPEDLKEYNEWKLGFVLDEKGEEIEKLIEENGVIEEIYNEIVPGKVDRETFWSRYFYRVYKIKKAEEARAKLVERAISGEEEDLSWDVDDDDYEESDESKSKLKSDSRREVEEKPSSGKEVENSVVESEGKGLKGENDEKGVSSELKGENVVDESESSGNKLEAKSDEKLGSEGKADNGGSCKDSDFSVISTQPSMHEEEEDLSWDEIEDLGNNDEIKVTASGSPNRADLRKRLSVAEEEEDLSWDIEDDDEPLPVKS